MSQITYSHQYAHHPALLAVGSTVYLVHSSAVIDEDSMGQEVWCAISHNSGYTWTPSRPILPAALLPNQTNVANFTYWCNEAIWQRAFQSLAILELDDSTIWAMGQTTDFFCWGDIGSGNGAAGRIARQISPIDGYVLFRESGFEVGAQYRACHLTAGSLASRSSS